MRVTKRKNVVRQNNITDAIYLIKLELLHNIPYTSISLRSKKTATYCCT